MNSALFCHLFQYYICFYLKIFDIRARLILSVSTEEGGEMQTDEFDCPAEETMSQCGVDGNAKLFVRVVEPLPEDELYEED